MSTRTETSSANKGSPNIFPLRFVDHDFEAYCFNTLACTVIYNHFNFTRLEGQSSSGPPASADYKEKWWPASHTGIRNFPSPAEVRWTSLDGVAHEAKIDVGDIFKDERVLYKVPVSEIREGAFPQGFVVGPSIFFEVNNRTINVYMIAMIPTKTEQIPGNKYSYARKDVMLAWTHTY